jgi:hypothetical protein
MDMPSAPAICARPLGLHGEARGRGMRISKKARARILACTDIEQIDAWLRKAASVASVDELF